MIANLATRASRFSVPRRFSTAALITTDAKTLKKDVVIVGGGAIGCSTAFWLKSLQPELKIAVIEREPSYSYASTPRSAGGIRTQFSNAENIQLCLHSAQFMRDINKYLNVHPKSPIDIGFVETGYLFLASKAGELSLRNQQKTQISLGAKVKLIEKHDIPTQFPWLNTAGIELGSFGYEYEGRFDPWLLLHAFRDKCLDLGVKFVTGETLAFNMNTGKTGIQSVVFSDHHGGSDRTVECTHVINCSGAWSGSIARLAGVSLPVEPRKRCVFMLHCKEAEAAMKTAPLVIDPETGVYFRHEGQAGSGMFLSGVSPEPEHDHSYATEPHVRETAAVRDTHLTVTADDHLNLWESIIWPALARRVPIFENAKQQSCWGGFYDYNTFDQNAMIGKHAEVGNFWCNTGFSGHGVQQAPMAGRALAEQFLGLTPTIDVSRLSPNRFQNGERVIEDNIV